MAQRDDIRKRLVEFAQSVMDLCDRLPKPTACISLINYCEVEDK
jgi:hypothetical protein